MKKFCRALPSSNAWEKKSASKKLAEDQKEAGYKEMFYSPVSQPNKDTRRNAWWLE